MTCVHSIEVMANKLQVTLEHWRCLTEIVTALNGAPVRRIMLKERTLEDVFISLTGAGVRE